MLKEACRAVEVLQEVVVTADFRFDGADFVSNFSIVDFVGR